MSCLDDFEFLLGVPTPAEMWRQHARLLEDEVADLQLELRETKRKLRTVIALRDEALKELEAEKAKTKEQVWKISNLHLENAELAKRAMDCGYKNDYSKGTPFKAVDGS